MGTISKKNGNNEYGPSGLAHQWRREGGGWGVGGGGGGGGHMPPGAGRGGAPSGCNIFKLSNKNK